MKLKENVLIPFMNRAWGNKISEQVTGLSGGLNPVYEPGVGKRSDRSSVYRMTGS